MKIIGKSATDYLVEASEYELMLAAGFNSVHNDGWKKLLAGTGWDAKYLPIGTVINVTAAYNFHRRIADHQDKARSSAAFLRGLADMLDGAMPDVIIPPTTEEPTK